MLLYLCFSAPTVQVRALRCVALRNCPLGWQWKGSAGGSWPHNGPSVWDDYRPHNGDTALNRKRVPEVIFSWPRMIALFGSRCYVLNKQSKTLSKAQTEFIPPKGRTAAQTRTWFHQWEYIYPNLGGVSSFSLNITSSLLGKKLSDADNKLFLLP